MVIHGHQPMHEKILIFHSNKDRARPLAAYFSRKGASVWFADELHKAVALAQANQPDLVFVDLHAEGSQWVDVLNGLRVEAPGCTVIATTHHPDVRKEMQAREAGVDGFLREPFTNEWIERATKRAVRGGTPSLIKPVQPSVDLPRVRMPMSLKITVPYALLALVFAMGAIYLVSRYVFESLRDRFTAQLVDSGVLAADWMVQEENRMLETVRLVANIQGLDEAILAGDTTRIQEIVLPVAMNYNEEAIDILNASGVSLLTLRNSPSGSGMDFQSTWGDTSLAQNTFIQQVLGGAQDAQGDKFAGVVRSERDSQFVIAGPIYSQQGERIGAVVVGRSLLAMVQAIRQDTLAHITVYAIDGNPAATTLLFSEDISPLAGSHVVQVLAQQDQTSLMREFQSGSASYAEIFGPWEIRGGQDVGVIGSALAQNFLARPTLVTRLQLAGFVLMVFFGVIFLGIIVAHQITSPLSKVVQASVLVAQGNFEVKVPSKSNDEVGVLGYAFNYMVSGLQEGFIYRDILGRTVSPEVREALRQSFASGDLRLEGQNTVATVLMSDVRGFTALSEREEPTTILNWLNEYFRVLVPIITAHGGVVDKFEGDAMLAFFGILPKPTPPEESAFHACCAAVEMLKALNELNQIRAARGEPALITGIGVNTGELTAGGLGTADRLNYTIIGDTVNSTQRLQESSREFGENGVVISEYTLEALAGRRGQFRLMPLGEQSFKGKRELIWLYRLMPVFDTERPTRPVRRAAEKVLEK